MTRRHKGTFGSLLYESFHSTYGPFITVAGLVLVFVGYFYVPSTETVGLRYVLLYAAVSLYLVFIFIHAAFMAHSKEEDLLPDVRYASEAPQAYQPSVALLLLSPSPLYSYDAVVAVYKEENGIEQLMGLGRVTNVQENGCIQVLVTHDLGYESEWTQYRRNDATLLKQMIVKPTVPGFAMEAALNG